MDIIRVRASGLWLLLDCPKRWKHIHIDGWQTPASVPAHIGTSLHAATAVYDDARVRGDTVTVDDAAGVLVDTLQNPEEDVDWGSESRRRAEARGLTLLSRYCADVAPGYDWEAVELPLEPLQVDFPDLGITLELTGTLDRVRRSERGRNVVDIKSGERAVNADGEAKTQGHGIQLGVYELLYQHTTGLAIDEPAQILGFQTTSAATIGTGEIPSPRNALIGTEDQPGLLEYAARIIAGEHWYGNSHSVLCSPRYCPAFNDPCLFRL